MRRTQRKERRKEGRKEESEVLPLMFEFGHEDLPKSLPVSKLVLGLEPQTKMFSWFSRIAEV